jgi:demethylspheroidene O-methyltransferase
MIWAGVRAALRLLVDGVSGAWLATRNRMLCNPGFQRWAEGSWLARSIARRRASALFDISAGFVYSQVLYAAARVGLLDILHAGPRSVLELAMLLDLSRDATQRLLDAAASLGLVQARGASYWLGIHGCSFVGNPAVARLVEHNAMFYRDLADPIALLRGEVGNAEVHRFWTYTQADAPPASARGVGAYTDLMAASIPLLVEDILESYAVADHRRLLDVGGGEGAFLEAAATHAPDLQLMLFDLPGVATRASARLERAGLSSRVRIVPGDWRRDPLPEGADLVSLVRVLHDHDDAQALELLRAVRRVLRPGGVLLIAEPMRGTTGGERMGDAYFGFYLMAMGQGRVRSPAEVTALLAQAGFGPGRLRNTRRPMISRLISAAAV